MLWKLVGRDRYAGRAESEARCKHGVTNWDHLQETQPGDEPAVDFPHQLAILFDD